jgi:hypothetical protein
MQGRELFGRAGVLFDPGGLHTFPHRLFEVETRTPESWIRSENGEDPHTCPNLEL